MKRLHSRTTSDKLILKFDEYLVIEVSTFEHFSFFSHTLFWVGAEGGVYFFWASGGGLRVGTGFDTEGGYRGGTVSKKKILNGPKRPN